MPVEEKTDINLGIDEKTFDDIDRAAAKAIKTLEKRNRALKTTIATGAKAKREQKRLEDRGGIFGIVDPSVPKGGGPPRDLAPLSKQDKRTEKRFKKLTEDVRKDTVKQFGKKGFLEKAVGKDVAKNIFSLGKSPKSFLTGALKALPILGGILAAKEIADFIVDEIIKIDKFLKKFIDIVDNRVDAFRTLQEQANIQAGISQRIITTASGSTEPRYSYNTLEQFNSDQAELESKFQMTNNSGVE